MFCPIYCIRVSVNLVSVFSIYEYWWVCFRSTLQLHHNLAKYPLDVMRLWLVSGTWRCIAYSLCSDWLAFRLIQGARHSQSITSLPAQSRDGHRATSGDAFGRKLRQSVCLLDIWVPAAVGVDADDCAWQPSESHRGDAHLMFRPNFLLFAEKPDRP